MKPEQLLLDAMKNTAGPGCWQQFMLSCQTGHSSGERYICMCPSGRKKKKKRKKGDC